MRAVETVKDKRNQLQNELVAFMNAKKEKYPVPTSFNELDDYGKQEFSYLMSCINSLRIQINALEFVLNEDTEINDYTDTSHQFKKGEVTKESALSYD